MTSGRLPLRPYGLREVWAPTGRESAAFDAWAIEEEGVPAPVLMENAGRSAALVLQRLWPEGRVVALVGSGNNGGDALVLLRSLAAWGRDVSGILVAEREPSGVEHGRDLALEADGALGDAEWARVLGGASVVVDGILGTGVRGAPRARQAAAIARLNGAGPPVLALDVPSGVDAATGAVPGEGVRAHVTVAFGAPKLGTLLHPGCVLAGRLVAVEIGFPPAPRDRWARVVTPSWARSLLPVRASDTHKNAVGRLVVVAGRVGMAGAAVLAARAAFRAGAGLVRVASPEANRAVLQAAVPEAIYVSPGDGAALADALAASDAVAVGPGLGTDEAAEHLLARVLEAPSRPTLADADALNLLAAGRPTAVAAVAAERPLLVTPHAGEMARLTGRPAEEILADRVGAARAAAAGLACWVLLKGAPSLVAGPDGELRVDSVGSSDLAVAGLGDALTGVCGALLAQGTGPADAASAGLYVSGRAAALAGKGRGLSPADVVRWLPEALEESGAAVTDLDLPFVTFDRDPVR